MTEGIAWGVFVAGQPLLSGTSSLLMRFTGTFGTYRLCQVHLNNARRWRGVVKVSVADARVEHEAGAKILRSGWIGQVARHER